MTQHASTRASASSRAGPDGGAPVLLRAPGGPTARLDGLFRLLEKPLWLLERAAAWRLPEGLNPFQQAGAIANTSFLVAAVTGILLLFWYTPSVHSAYASVKAMADQPYTAGLLRALHRYSSDACMFFVLFHAVKMLLGRKFDGPRWLPWVTGSLLLLLLWFVGWIGYWLVWDERARQVALGTAPMMDVLPIFVDPLSRSFLTDAGINSLLFFLVFFGHMLLPLAMALALWLHIVRLSRARFLTKGAMTWWVVGSLLLVSLLAPVGSAEPARMAVEPDGFTMDWWYLLPVALTDRLGAGALWGAFLVLGLPLLAIPWWLTRRRPATAVTITALCNACQNCYHDCPYDAITMVPRRDGRTFPAQSEVNPARCTGCGVCVGSCCSGGIQLPWLSTQMLYDRIAAWAAAESARGGELNLALLAADGAVAGAVQDAASGACVLLPGYRAVEMPCGGAINPLVVERALRQGAARVLVAGCAKGFCTAREGADWMAQRFAGERDPTFREPWRHDVRVRLLELKPGETRKLQAEARAFRAAAPDARRGPGPRTVARRLAAGLAGAVLAASIGAVVWLFSDLGYASPDHSQPVLVVSFKHPGRYIERAREMTPEELEALPVHMRPKSGTARVDRHRADVRMRITVDGEVVLEGAYPPGGIWGDGNSRAVEKVSLAPGMHQVRVEIDDSGEPERWEFAAEQAVEARPHHRSVVLFDRVSGFRWH